MRETYRGELIMLLGYETDRGRHSILWDSPFYFNATSGQSGKQLDDNYSNWMSTKRPVQTDELLDGMWKKISDHGYTFVVRFLPDGTFIEHSVISEQNVGHGTWIQIGPFTRTRLEQMEAGEKASYELTLIANKTGLMHSAIEQRNGRTNAYFKMIHLI